MIKLYFSSLIKNSGHEEIDCKRVTWFRGGGP